MRLLISRLRFREKDFQFYERKNEYSVKSIVAFRFLGKNAVLFIFEERSPKYSSAWSEDFIKCHKRKNEHSRVDGPVAFVSGVDVVEHTHCASLFNIAQAAAATCLFARSFAPQMLQSQFSFDLAKSELSTLPNCRHCLMMNSQCVRVWKRVFCV